MILKNMDEHSAELATIERLLLAEPADTVSRALKQDRATILNSLKHQRDSAYHLDFYFKESRDWVVLHDLRLEMGENVAQIDHLLINRQLDIYVVESRFYNSDIKIDDKGDFHCLYNKKPVIMSSPVARNLRHIDFLHQYLGQNGLLPTRLGLTIKPRYHNIVLVSPTSRVTRPNDAGDSFPEVVAADRFLNAFKRAQHEYPLTDFVNLARQLTPEALHGMAARLAQRHFPRSIDFAERYGLKHGEYSEEVEDCGESCRCSMCQKRITSRVARYCYTNREMFAGKVYCFSCQRSITLQAGNA